MINIDDEENKKEEINEETSNESSNEENAEETLEEENEEVKEAEEKTEDELTKAKEEAKLNYDKYLRVCAEYDNYQKRTQREKCDMYDKGIMETVGNFLDVIDNFDRALSGIKKDELDDKSKAVVDGIEMIRSQMDKALNKIGVTAIEAKDKEFDPRYHNAVMHVEDENIGENIIVEELQRGYMFNDKVVRCSMVKVAN